MAAGRRLLALYRNMANLVTHADVGSRSSRYELSSSPAVALDGNKTAAA
jgi:hypothetical protein